MSDDVRVGIPTTFNGVRRGTIYNVRPCCKVCNFAKGTLSEEQFFKWVGTVYDRLWEILDERGKFDHSPIDVVGGDNAHVGDYATGEAWAEAGNRVQWRAT